jgi:hypothetical protein
VSKNAWRKPIHHLDIGCAPETPIEVERADKGAVDSFLIVF